MRKVDLAGQTGVDQQRATVGQTVDGVGAQDRAGAVHQGPGLALVGHFGEGLDGRGAARQFGDEGAGERHLVVARPDELRGRRGEEAIIARVAPGAVAPDAVGQEGLGVEHEHADGGEHGGPFRCQIVGKAARGALFAVDQLHDAAGQRLGIFAGLLVDVDGDRRGGAARARRLAAPCGQSRAWPMGRARPASESAPAPAARRAIWPMARKGCAVPPVRRQCPGRWPPMAIRAGRCRHQARRLRCLSQLGRRRDHALATIRGEALIRPVIMLPIASGDGGRPAARCGAASGDQRRSCPVGIDRPGTAAMAAPITMGHRPMAPMIGPITMKARAPS
jgi:hypothetical protein